MKKSKYERFAPIVSNRTVAIALSTSFSPIGDHFLSPPRVWPAAKRSEITQAIRSSRVVLTTIPLAAWWPQMRNILSQPQLLHERTSDHREHRDLKQTMGLCAFDFLS